MGITHHDGLSVGEDGLNVGTGSDIKKIKSGTVTVDPASIAATTSGETAVTITGVAVGDIVIFEPPSALETGLAYGATGRVSAADTVQLRLTNVTGLAIDGASLTWRYLWVDLT
jgi:hypothetical protein